MRRISGDRFLIDLHCDTLTECKERGVGLVSREMPHFSLDRLPASLRLCQCMAVFMPDTLRGPEAVRYFNAVYAVYVEQLRRHRRRLAPVSDTGKITDTLRQMRVACILTVEGGSVLAGDPAALDGLYRKGVRMMTLTWNAENEIAGGADTDTGFTPLGREVVARMERLGMAVDVSHLSDRAFWELCAFAGRPFVASHSNARAVCGHRRNLTDDMFREIARRGGVVGLNYAKNFIAPGGDTATVDDLLRHVHHFLELGGERTLALGSDFDGADLPPYLAGVDKLEALIDALERSGIPSAAVDAILFHNANRYFCALRGQGQGRGAPPPEDGQ